MRSCLSPIYNLTNRSFNVVSSPNSSPTRRLTTYNSVKMSRILTLDSINPNVKTMEYAVRGPIVIRAVEIEKELEQSKNKSFPNVIKANIGDAHAMGQTPITFIRQVLACVSYPALLESSEFPEDVKEHSRELLKSVAGGSVGSYSQSTGIDLIRKHIAQFIERRDGFPCNYERVLISGGASEAIRNVLKLFINRDGTKKTGIMIPIPQYPLYSASVEEFNLGQVGYFLNEDNNWALDLQELERSFAEHKDAFNIKALVVINPGNPTGQVLSKQNIQEIIKFAHDYRLFVFADEVYQENVYAKGSSFHSFKKILMEMGEPYSTNVELASFYSCSKGYMGECGLRGGYVELVNICPDVFFQFAKMISAKLCSTVIGQIVMDCVVNHPKPGDPSYDLWNKEKTAVLDSLKKRAQLAQEAYGSIKGITVNEIQGAMYGFPRIHLPQKAIDEAKAQNVEPDFFYAKQLLESTGVCIVPGSGFGQVPGTYHFRTTILPQPETFKDMLSRFQQFHEKFLEKYA